MTQKAKAYDEALEQARKFHRAFVSGYNYPAADIKASYEAIFPELKESKDERIRKELIKLLRNLFNNYSYFIKDPFYTECITWLEKQGEQKHHDTWKPSAHELEVLRLAAEKDGTCLMGLYEQLKKLREE